MVTRILLFAISLLSAHCTFAQSKIAHLNTQEILEATLFYNTIEQKIQEREGEIRSELKGLMAEFEESISCYTDHIAQCRSPILDQREEQLLFQKEKEIRDCQESAQAELQAYSEELNQHLVALFDEAVKIVCDRHNYDYVFDVSTLMIHNGLDITQDVIAEIVKLE